MAQNVNIDFKLSVADSTQLKGITIYVTRIPIIIYGTTYSLPTYIHWN